MKRYINKIILVIVSLLSITPCAIAQVDLQSSFMVMRKDNLINGVLEGGEWIIRFSDTDTLGNEYNYPVAMRIQSVVAPDTTFVPMESVDSVLFQMPDSEMESGIFKLTEEHLKYIVATDSVSIVNFRIDCLSKIDLPKVGQKVFCEILRDPLPFGLIGRVESFKVSYDDGWIQMICEPLTLSDIYKKYYKVSITERDEGTIVPASRSLCSLDPKGASLQEYEITKKPSGIPVKQVGYVVFDGKWAPHFTNNVKTVAGAHRAELGFDLDGSITVYHVSAIDRELDLDYTDVYADVDLLAKLHAKLSTCQYNKSYGGWAGDRFSYSDTWKLPLPPIPTPVPGLGINFTGGFKISAGLDIALFLKPEIPIRKRIGAHIDGLNSRPIWEDLPGSQEPENEVSASLNPSLRVSGKLAFGPFIELGLTIAKLFDLGVQVNPGVEFEGKIEFAPEAAIGAVDNLASANVSDMKKNYTSLVQNNKMGINVGVKLDGVATFNLISKFDVSLVQLLKDLKILKGDPFMFPAFTLSVLPSFACSDMMLMSTESEDLYSVTFECKDVYPSLMSAIAKGGIFLLDKNDKYLAHYESSEPALLIFDRSKDYSLGRNLRGNKVKVYPYLHTPFTGYITPGIAEENVYIPFHPTLEILGEPNQTTVEFRSVVDDVIKENPDRFSGKTGVLIESEDGSRKQEFPVDIKDGVMEGQIDRDLFTTFFGLKTKSANMYSYVYDNENKEYSYSNMVNIQYLSFEAPTTLPTPAEEIDYECATFYAELHQELIKMILNEIYDNDYNDDFVIDIGFCVYPKDTPEKSISKEITITREDNYYSYIKDDKIFSLLIDELIPHTKYEYYAYVKVKDDINKVNETYKGDVYTFTTPTPIEKLYETEVGADYAVLCANVKGGYADPGNYRDMFFEVDELYDYEGESRVIGLVYPEDIIENEDGSYQISAKVTGLKPEQDYKYRAVLTTNDYTRVASGLWYFTTAESDLKAITGGATVDGNTATVSGEFTPRLLELLQSQDCNMAYFECCTDDKFEAGNRKVVAVVIKSTDYTATIKDLSYSTLYYYRFYVKDADDNLYQGDILSFVTDNAPVENVEECYTLPASVEDANVIMSGGVPAATLTAIEDGVYKNVQYGFEVAESQSELKGTTPTFATKEIDMDTGMFTITKVLQPNTTYYIRAMVFFNDKWVAAPEVVSVKTADFDPGLIPPDIN